MTKSTLLWFAAALAVGCGGDDSGAGGGALSPDSSGQTTGDGDGEGTGPGDGDGDGPGDGDGDGSGHQGDGDGEGDGGSGAELSCDPPCGPAEFCKLTVVQCFAPPCDLVQECAPRPSCGGFVGNGCPGAGSCIDDPNDSCDAQSGGADCAGLCICDRPTPCPADSQFDTSPESCACASTI